MAVNQNVGSRLPTERGQALLRRLGTYFAGSRRKKIIIKKKEWRVGFP
jgi:hypothetical protein